jgi:hypothetical protein
MQIQLLAGQPARGQSAPGVLTGFKRPSRQGLSSARRGVVCIGPIVLSDRQVTVGYPLADRSTVARQNDYRILLTTSPRPSHSIDSPRGIASCHCHSTAWLKPSSIQTLPPPAVAATTTEKGTRACDGRPVPGKRILPLRLSGSLSGGRDFVFLVAHSRAC